jgi:ubiquinone/menaquinone biosynthesis C-methylase UbiE
MLDLHLLAVARHLHLLPPAALLVTGKFDRARWNYRPVLGTIQRVRFAMVKSLLPQRRVPRLLELGYGSGVFLAELSEHCTELLGIDIHPYHRPIAQVLARQGVQAQLQCARAESLPFESQSMDIVVATSTLEFVDDVERACQEVRRVLRPSGCFVVVTPGRSPLADAGLTLLTGRSARAEFGARRDAVRPALRRSFQVQAALSFPSFGGVPLKLYDAMRLSPDLGAPAGSGSPLSA